MTKIYQSEEYLSTLVESFNKKLESGDYLGALTALNSIERVQGNTPDTHAKRARIYFVMDRFSLACAEWFKYLSKVNGKQTFSRAYSTLAACFYRMGDENLGGYYFRLQVLEDGTTAKRYSTVAQNYYSDVIFTKDSYYLAYPYEIADFTKTVKLAEKLMKNGDFKGVIKELSIIPEKSRFYPPALLTISIAKFFDGDVDGAIKDVEKSIRLQPTVTAICNAISMLTSIEDYEKVNFYLEKLATVKSNNGEEDNKIAMIYCEHGREVLAENYANSYLRNNEYDNVMLMLSGMINYNLKKYEKAKKRFSKAYRITGSYIAKYYLQLCTTKEFDKLSYGFDLPEPARKQIIKKIGELIRADDKVRLERQDEIYEISDYAFSTDNYQLQSSAITLLGELSTKKSYEIIKDSLISMNVFDRVKSGAIGFLVADGYSGELSAVFSNIFKKTKVYKAKFNKNNGVFTEAYAYLYAKLCHLEKDMKPIKLSIEEVYKALDEKDLLREVCDVKSLAAVIYELSSIANIKSRREFASYFDANLREIKRIKTLIDKI